jgi:protoheme IX farnesyltransferase
MLIRLKIDLWTKANKSKPYLVAMFLSFLLVTTSLINLSSFRINLFFQILISILTTIILTVWFVRLNNQDIRGNFKPDIQKSIRFLMISSFLMIFLGVILSITESAKNCLQFPICINSKGTIFDLLLVNFHRFFTLITGILLINIVNKAWMNYRENPGLLVSITISFVVFLGQSFIGGLQVVRDLPTSLLFVHSSSTLIFLLSIIYAYSLSKYVIDMNQIETKTIFNDSQRRKDFIILNKPIIVALLLVTTYAGMVVGGEKFPSMSLTFWTLLGGALAAGGASAINQYIDRDIDLSMQRTAKRPLPDGRLRPAEALALGISEIILSFYIFSAFVNLNAALLAMAGMIYYVFIYSKWLKLITVQNIVIGGGAGAIPPLVGWAAATGGLNIPSIFLFALVFLWTPPHFWALALVRKNDYARANIPMMPVIKGEKKTRLQILIYTIQLVLLTLLMPLFGVGGSIYFILAVVLGLWLISTAWQVYKKEGNKIAFKMYRYSSMYLAFIFLALVLDVLI